MASERLFRTRVVNTFRQQFPLAQVIVLSQRFKGGLPDLYVQAPGYSGVFLELKWTETKHMPPYKLALSPLQRAFITKTQKAGGDAGWVLGVRRGKGPIEVYAGTHTHYQTTIYDQICSGKVDARAILDRIGGHLAYGRTAVRTFRDEGDPGDSGNEGPV